MANYKLITFTPTASATSQLAFTASGTNTVVTSVVASDSATSTLEVLVKKNGGSIIELAHSQVQSDKPEELVTAPFALEALDELYVRTSRTGAQFVISYVEETTTPNDTALGGLIDVDTTGVSDGQSLVYSSSNSQWEPQTITGGGGSGSSTLDGLTDTTISSLQSGNLLRWTGSTWANIGATTSIITEGTNLYYTDARVDARIAADTTKADASHTHDHNDITDFDTATNALIAAHPDLGEDNVNADWNATSGDAEILNKPSLFDGDYNSLTNQPSLFDGDYNSLTNQPSLFDGDYTSLTNVPSTFTPSSHTHVAADITNFNTSVDSRIALADSKQLHETGPITTVGDTNNGAELMEFTTTSLTLTVGDVYSLGSTGWEAATNADSSADNMLAIPVNGNDDGSEMLLKGVVKIDLVTSGASTGDAVYLGTGNKATLTAPTSSARVIKLGRVLSTSGVIFFNPDATSIELQ